VVACALQLANQSEKEKKKKRMTTKNDGCWGGEGKLNEGGREGSRDKRATRREILGVSIDKKCTEVGE